MRAWRRPPGYLAFVVVGFVCVVGATVATAVATSEDPGNKAPLYVGVAAIAVFVALLLAYQWVGVFLGGRSTEREEVADPAGPGDPRADLLAGLAIEPGVESSERRARRQVLGGAVRYQVLVTAMGLAVVLGGLLYVIGGVDTVWRPFGETGIGLPLAFVPVFAILILALLTLPGQVRGWVGISDDLYRPLGLQVTELPRLVILPGFGDSTRLVGDTIVAGTRHGRRVEVSLGSRRHTVGIEGRFPRFSVVAGREGALVSGDAPAPGRGTARRDRPRPAVAQRRRRRRPGRPDRAPAGQQQRRP
ncbi:MAG TPA: hypothetical protein VF529_13505 [Solirubrobacteraceae bacterium]